MTRLSMKVCGLDKTPICELLDNTPSRARSIFEKFAINEITTLSFDLPVVPNGKWRDLSNETLIYFNNEYYNVKTLQFTHSQDDKLLLHVEAKHLSEILASQLISVEETTPRTIEELLKIALLYDENNASQTGWTIGNIDVDRVKVRGLEANEQSPFSVILSIVEKWDAIAIFDSKTMRVNVIPSRKSTHPSLDLRVSKNLKEVNITYDTSDMCTRLYGYGAADEDSNELDIMSVNPTGLPYVDNFDYFINKGYTAQYIEDNPQMFVRTNIYRESSIYDAQDLYNNTVNELSKISQPKVDVKIQALNTTQIKANNIVNVALGDSVLVHDEDLGMSFVCNVISKDIDYENPHLLNVELVNSIQYRDIIAELFNSVNSVSSIVHSGGIQGGIDMDDLEEYLNTYYLNTEQLDAKYATINELKANYVTSEYLISNYIDAQNIGATYATITSLNAVEAKIQNLDVNAINAKFADIDKLIADQGDFLKLIATDAEIEQLKAGDLSVYGLLSASNAEIETIKSTYVQTGSFEAYKATVENLFALYATIEELEANYLKASQIEADYAKITSLEAAIADIETLNTNLANVEKLVAEKASIEDLNATNANITKLNADLANVNTLLATKVDAEYVEAEIVEATKVLADDIDAINAVIENLDAKYATIETLNAKVAEINTLIAKKATIEELNAAVADIGTLTGQVANINSILAGNIGTGTLQTIRLTADNVVIDDAVIKELIAAKINVSDLKAGTISTDKFTIKSDDGGIEIVGSVQQFYDDNGNVRLQMGKDAQGNFSFIVVGEDGTTTLFDHTGMKAAGVPDGLIVNKMVADNANISGSKLDIDSVIDKINEDGTKTIKSSKIWIDEENQSLGAKFDTITEDINDINAEVSKKVNQTDFVVEQGKITSLISETTVIKSTAESALTKADENNKELQTIRDEMTTNLRIESSRGTVFKNSGVNTVLSAVIFRGSERITNITALRAAMGNSAYLQWKWQRLGENSFGVISSSDSRIGNDGFTFTLSPSDVDTKVTFMCELIV